MQFTDEQQKYIDEHYQLLPCDADGVPIHVGDKMQYENPNDDDKPFTVLGVNNDGDVFHCLEDKRLVPTCISLANCLRHVKPRTLEDVLIEYRLEAYNLYADQELTGEERVNEFKKLDAEYDSEIRELLLGGDE